MMYTERNARAPATVLLDLFGTIGVVLSLSIYASLLQPLLLPKRIGSVCKGEKDEITIQTCGLLERSKTPTVVR